MEKQTAVEWLFKELWDTPKDKLNWYAIRSKALEMEKQQEISDEEIEVKAEKWMDEEENMNYYESFIQGAKWYREKLSKKN